MHLEFFACSDEVERLRTALRDAAPARPIALLLALAWQLRQRDTTGALQLADDIEAALSCGGPGLADTEASRTMARLHLIRAEAHWLQGALELAEAQIALAEARFHALGDDTGCGDVHWLIVFTINERGDTRRSAQEAQAAVKRYERAGDAQRCALAGALLPFRVAVFDPPAAQRLLDAEIGAQAGERHPALATWLSSSMGRCAELASDYGAAAKWFAQGYQGALASGQLRQAIVCATNVSENFMYLHDHASALEWVERALELARETKWPFMIGLGLSSAGEILRAMDHAASAQAMLLEACDLMLPTKGSRNYARLVTELGKVTLDLGEHARALDWFAQAEAVQRGLNATDELVGALHGRTLALKGLARLDEALALALDTLATSRALGYINRQIDFLQIVADLRRQLPAAAPAGAATDTTLGCLSEALALAAAIEGYIVPVRLLEQVAAEHADAGDFAKAYRVALAAGLSREKLQGRDAAKRAIALHVKFDTEKARTEAAHHRQLAAAQALRADTLLDANETLETLGAVGQEITANLDHPAILNALDRHVHALLETSSFVVYLMDVPANCLRSVLRVEAGRALPVESIELGQTHRYAARCALEQREIALELIPGVLDPSHVSGTLSILSALFRPLMINGRLIGVMTVQSPVPRAYQTRERLIFKALCAYGAIALSNAQAYDSAEKARAETALAIEVLKQTQTQLVQSEKMASLGQLVANVAHELNTPIGAIKSSGQNIVVALTQLLQSLPALLLSLEPADAGPFLALLALLQRPAPPPSSREERALRRELAARLETMDVAQAPHKADILAQCRIAPHQLDAIAPVLRSARAGAMLDAAYNHALAMQNADNINVAVESVSRTVFALKSFARPGAALDAADTDLAASVDAVLLLYRSKIARGTELVKRYAPIPPLLAYADDLSQVWHNLIHNALQAMGHKGVLTVGIRAAGGEAIIDFADNGCGIAPEIQQRIFEPFFTTKAVGEGSGLGLDIVRQIVVKHSGRIELTSTVGLGSTFSVHLPYPANRARAPLPS
ncbi:MAG: ATP-binding protein [Pseudomonadota bacterium]